MEARDKSKPVNKIKSAFEKAMEKADQLPPPTNEERLQWKWTPEGKRLAGLFLASREGASIKDIIEVEELAKPYLTKGIIGILVEAIRVPENESTLQTGERALNGLIDLIGEPLKEISDRVHYVWNQYLQFYHKQVEEAIEQMKPMLQEQLEHLAQERTGTQGPVDIGPIEARPEYQAQRIKLLIKMREPYENHISDFRTQIRELI